jgi:hypothetical protein
LTNWPGALIVGQRKLLAARPRRYLQLIPRSIHSHPYRWFVRLPLVPFCRSDSALRSTTWPIAALAFYSLDSLFMNPFNSFCFAQSIIVFPVAGETS